MAIELVLPAADALRAELLSLGRTVDAISPYLVATETNYFVHPDGRHEALEDIVIPPVQAALLSRLGKRCSTRLSIEIGFRMGSTASAILGTRRHVGNPFDHMVFEPHGLQGPAPGTMRGAIVESYLKQEFEGNYHRFWKPRATPFPIRFITRPRSSTRSAISIRRSDSGSASAPPGDPAKIKAGMTSELAKFNPYYTEIDDTLYRLGAPEHPWTSAIL